MESGGSKVEEESIKTPDGKASLYMHTWKPEGKIIATVTLLHGLGEHCRRYDHVFQKFVEAGIQVHSFDLRGHGRSSGKRGVTYFPQCWRDLDFVIEKNEIIGPHFLYGHSMGGGLVLGYIMNGRAKNIAGAIVSSPMIRAAIRKPGLEKSALVLGKIMPCVAIPNGLSVTDISRVKEECEKYAKDPFNTAMAAVGLGRDMLVNGETVLRSGDKFNLPMLLFHGSGDRITSSKASEEFFEKMVCKEKTLKIYDSYYHECHNESEEDRKIVINNMVEWIQERVAKIES